ncbi:MAG: hypothetical protein ACXVAR_17285 [Vulcanimicrobiaceae bacterium]
MLKGVDIVLKWFVKKQLEAFERRWNYDTGYVREIVDEAGVDAVMPMQGLQKLSGYRGGVPLSALYGASLTAAKHADCGPCLQLAVSMAEAEGLSADIIRAILRHDLSALPAEALLGIEIAQSTIARDGTGEDARQEILRRWGRRGLVALAYGIVAAQAYPAFKYAIGHGHACVRVQVGNETVAMREPNFA